jgi:hypothetical protein
MQRVLAGLLLVAIETAVSVVVARALDEGQA